MFIIIHKNKIKVNFITRGIVEQILFWETTRGPHNLKKEEA